MGQHNKISGSPKASGTCSHLNYTATDGDLKLYIERCIQIFTSYTNGKVSPNLSSCVSQSRVHYKQQASFCMPEMGICG